MYLTTRIFKIVGIGSVIVVLGMMMYMCATSIKNRYQHSLPNNEEAKEIEPVQEKIQIIVEADSEHGISEQLHKQIVIRNACHKEIIRLMFKQFEVTKGDRQSTALLYVSLIAEIIGEKDLLQENIKILSKLLNESYTKTSRDFGILPDKP